MEFDNQPNGPRKRATHGRNRNSLANVLSKQKSLPTAYSRKASPSSLSTPDRGVVGGWADSPERKAAMKQGLENLKRKKELGKQIKSSPLALPSAQGSGPLAISEGQASQTTQTLQNVTSMLAQSSKKGGQGGGQDGGGIAGAMPSNAIRRQLYKGFVSAGRPDLARMVKTGAFKTWIGGEGSGWDPTTISQYYPGHGQNSGLFQFANNYHPWVANFIQNGDFTASPYQQARMVARYFPQLDPRDIRSYARQIRDGTYRGWG